jgi:hypothetical protein
MVLFLTLTQVTRSFTSRALTDFHSPWNPLAHALVKAKVSELVSMKTYLEKYVKKAGAKKCQNDRDRKQYIKNVLKLAVVKHPTTGKDMC